MSRASNLSVYEDLNTSFVNLGALLRYLEARGFAGRVRVALEDYEADITLRAGEKPLVREHNRTTGRVDEGEAALQRLLVRAMDAGGRIDVYREAGEETEQGRSLAGVESEAEDDEAGLESSGEGVNWQGLLRTSAELIAAVERAALGVGANFGAAFQMARLELADDYAFLDPNDARFIYAGGEVKLQAGLNPKAFVYGLCETLHRVVEKISVGRRSATVRERVALELAVLSRRRRQQLASFGILAQLDRIAGTRVI